MSLHFWLRQKCLFQKVQEEAFYEGWCLASEAVSIVAATYTARAAAVPLAGAIVEAGVLVATFVAFYFVCGKA